MHTKRIDDKHDVENRSMAEINELKTRIRCKQRAIQLADLVLQKTKQGNQLEAIDAGVLDAVKKNACYEHDISTVTTVAFKVATGQPFSLVRLEIKRSKKVKIPLDRAAQLD